MIKEKYSSLYHFEKLLIVFKTIDIYDNNLPIGRSVTNDGRNAESGKLARLKGEIPVFLNPEMRFSGVNALRYGPRVNSATPWMLILLPG